MGRSDISWLGCILIIFSLLFGGWLVFLAGVFLCVLSAFMRDD